MSGRGLDDVAPADLVGTWRLVRWEAIDADGAVSRPFGDGPIGYVVYTTDGHMITTVSRAGRPPIGGDLLSAPAEARAEAFGTFVTYAGTYRSQGRDVIHSVETSLYPDWVGTEQRRHVELAEDGNVLILTTDAQPTAGRMSRHRLRWERVEG